MPASGCNTLSAQGPDGSLERYAPPSARADKPGRSTVPTRFGRRCIPRKDLTSGHTEDPPAVAGREKATVQLESAVPSLSMRAGPGRLQLGVTPEMFEHVFREYHLGLFHSDWRLVPGLLPQTAKFLAAMPDLPKRATPCALQLFVDGSYISSLTGPPQCGWAVCALGFHEGCWYWIGWFASHTDPRGDVSTLGDTVSSAYEVELSAMCFALAVSVGVQAQRLIGFDSTAASLVAAAQKVAQTAMLSLLHADRCATYLSSGKPHPCGIISPRTRGTRLMSLLMPLQNLAPDIIKIRVPRSPFMMPKWMECLLACGLPLACTLPSHGPMRRACLQTLIPLRPKDSPLSMLGRQTPL